ncbi:MAG TPA: TonB family protein [Flavobacteriales bacterium]|nr:TonB family protein [Flavobacteriales bacterium]
MTADNSKKITVALFAFVFASLLSYSQKQKKITEYYYKKLRKSEGFTLDGKKDGTWTYWTLDGQIERIENYKNGKADGTFLYYEALDVPGVIPGKAAYKTYLASQKKLQHGPLINEINYKNGHKHGRLRTWMQESLITEATYVRDTLDGEYKEYRLGTRGEKFALRKLVVYKMGVYNGKYLDLSQGEQFKTDGTYVNGKKEGFWNEFYDRIIFENNYKNGVLHGKQTAYDIERHYLGFRTYQNGTLHGPFEEMLFDESRILQKISGTYVKGEKEGILKWYYGDKLMIEYNVYNGVNHGKMNYYYGNGQIMKQGNYMFGKIDSCWTYYTWQGMNEGNECFDEGMYFSLEYKYPNGKKSAQSVRQKDGTDLFTEYYLNGKKKNEIIRYYSHQYLDYIETHFDEKGKKTGTDTVWSNKPVFTIDVTPNLAPVNTLDYIYPGSYEVAPVFLGGYNAMYKFIYKNQQYPQTAKEKGIEGIVFTEFTVEVNGSLSNPVIISSPDNDLSAEAIRLIGILPKFSPAQVKGKRVRSKYQLAMQFKI